MQLITFFLQRRTTDLLSLSTELEDAALTISKTWNKAELPRGMPTFLCDDTCCHNPHHGVKHISFCMPKEVKLRKPGLSILKHSWLREPGIHFRISPSFFLHIHIDEYKVGTDYRYLDMEVSDAYFCSMDVPK